MRNGTSQAGISPGVEAFPPSQDRIRTAVRFPHARYSPPGPVALGRRELLRLSSDDDIDGGGNSDARCSMKGHYNNHRIDKVGSNCTGNSHIHLDNNDTRSSGNQIRLQLTPERQNAVRVRKLIRLPSKRLREVFSLLVFPFLFVVLRGRKAPWKGFPGRLIVICVTLY